MTLTSPDEQWLLKVLIVDDERGSLRELAEIVDAQGPVEIHRATHLQEARQVLEQVIIDVAFIDLRLSEDIRNRDGLTLVQEIRARYPQTIPIMVSAHSQLDEVSEAIKLGARNYVHKSEFEQRAPIILQDVRKELALNKALVDLRSRDMPDPAMGLIGTSEAMQHLRERIKKLAAVVGPVPPNILILGPTGAGKDLVAKALHQYGPYRSAPFLPLNCGAFDDSLIRNELFGHEKGAFTDAGGTQDGLFARVGQGTLFLDEVGELSPGNQAILLRVLENRTFRTLGPSGREMPFRGRIVAATHVDLRARVREGRFREDLYYRLNNLSIQVPPLSAHPEDIPALVQHFAKPFNKPLHFTQEAMELLCRHSWPGNVRELKSAIDGLIYQVDTERIDAESVMSLLSQEAAGDSVNELLETMARKLLKLPIEDKIGAITKALVQEAMRQSEGNITEAARKLGRHRKYVERSRKKLGDPDSEDPED